MHRTSNVNDCGGSGVVTDKILQITGGTQLSGSVAASGSKNASLLIMAAAVLSDGAVDLARLPQVDDVITLIELLRRLGLVVRWADHDRLLIEVVDDRPFYVPGELGRRFRAGLCVLGPLLARRGRAVVSLPGGCNLGPRPIDLHLAGLAALGADIRVQQGHIFATGRQLRGAQICLEGPHGPTVTGTANVLSAAVLAKGETTITGAAREPEIVDLGRFLLSMGAHIEGLGTSTLRVYGTDQLGGVGHRIIPDRIEVATLLMAGVVTGGRVTVTDLEIEHLKAVLETFWGWGLDVQAGPESVSVTADGRRPRAIDIQARPFPGLPTDLQALMMLVAAIADGTTRIEDNVFPDRWMHLEELRRFGAEIRQGSSGVVVSGVRQLRGAHVTACDLRAGAALVLGGLAAEGQTTVRQLRHVDRGYERLDEKLCQLGGHMARRMPQVRTEITKCAGPHDPYAGASRPPR